MKNLLLLLICTSFISLNVLSQEKKGKTAPSIKKEKAVMKKSVQLKQAKAPTNTENEKLKTKALREISPKKREEEQ